MRKPLTLIEHGDLLVDVAPKAGSNTLLSIFLAGRGLKAGSDLKGGTYWNFFKNNKLTVIKPDKTLVKFVRNPYARAVSIHSHFTRASKKRICRVEFFKKIKRLHKLMRGRSLPDVLSVEQRKQIDAIFPNINKRLLEMLVLQKNYPDVQFDCVIKLEDLQKGVRLLNQLYSLNLKADKIPHLNKGPAIHEELTEEEKKAVLEIYSEDFEIYNNARTFS